MIAENCTGAVITPNIEREIARDLTPAIAVPTLILALVLPVLFVAYASLGFLWIVPLWSAVPVLSLLSYAHYTLVHESIHGNLVPGYPRFRWLDEVVGWVGALGMSMAWPFLKRTHIKHHSHTNSHADPDILWKGTLSALIAKWCITTIMFLTPLPLLRYVARRRYDRISGALVGTEFWQVSAVPLLTLGLFALSLYLGRTAEFFCLWFIPTRVAMLILHIFFQWLPHHPFDRTERYLNTRISLWPGGALFTLQQNLHLMHHLWPSVPFYNYTRLYRRLRPVLISKGSRIEGLMVGRYAQDLRMEGNLKHVSP
ncbi:fatty acid desaturase [Bradyrhizobium sp. USDA 4473]